MKGAQNEKPHIIMILLIIAVLALLQIFNVYQERLIHQEMWDSLIEIQRDLNLSLENQNQHLEEVQEAFDYLQH